MLSWIVAAVALTAGAAQAEPPAPADEAVRLARAIAQDGPRPAGSDAERRAQDRVAERFRAAGLEVSDDGFRVPGRGRSRNVIARKPGRSSCLRVVMAHSDSVPPADGADDNASGLGALAALARALGPATPACEVWLVATGAEERPFTGQPDHLGASALVRRLRRDGRTRDVRYGLSLDEVGRGRSFWLRSPAGSPRAGVERALLASARQAGVAVRWVKDGSDSNSDHRELALAGMPAMKLGVPDDPCRHTACDRAGRLQRAAFERALKVVLPLVTE